MTRTRRRRIDTLQARAMVMTIFGCETCRSWPGIVIIDDDGSTTRPETCPDCGRQVPFDQVIRIVGVPLDTR